MSLHAHNFKSISDTPSGLREICVECKFILKTPKGEKGRIDNKKFLKEHIRDTAQPFGRTSKIFNKYYGEEAGYISKFK